LVRNCIYVVLICLAVAACGNGNTETESAAVSGDTTENGSQIDTALLTLSVDTKNLSELVAAGRGGAIEAFEGGILGIDVRGQLFYLALSGEVTTAPSNIQTNADTYYAIPEVAKEQDNVFTAERFRVIDIALRPRDNAEEIIVSYNHYDIDERCVSLRIGVLRAKRVLEVFSTPPKAEDWNVIYESSPCLALWFDGPNSGPVFQNGHVSGGRMAVNDIGEIIVGVGDYANNGVDAPLIVSQDEDTSYGKMVKLTEDGGEYEIISRGHRNPQGIVFAEDGTLYATEHGPRGGDELNIITEGGNYGWPHETLGTNYGSRTWPLNEKQGRHEVHERPLFSWIPSIGISSLIFVSDFAPEWNGDLLIASLRDNALWRTRVVNDRVMVDRTNSDRIADSRHR
jgi:hypothetical protein